MRYRSAVVAAVGVAWGAALVVGCRAIAGIDGDLTYAPGVPDAKAARDAPGKTPTDATRPETGVDARGADAGVDATHADAGIDATRADAGGDARHDVVSRDAGPDVRAPDANACPTAEPQRLFEMRSTGLGPIVLYGDTLYAEVIYDGEVPVQVAPYRGLIACPKSGCTTPTPAAAYPPTVQWGAVAAAAGGLLYSVATLEPTSGALDGGVSDAATAGSISRLAVDGGPSEVVVQGLQAPFLMASTADTLYWLDDPEWTTYTAVGKWRVYRCSLPACSDPEAFMEGPVAPAFGLYVDSTNVYVVAEDPGAYLYSSNLYFCAQRSKCMSTPPTVLTHLTSPSGNNGNTWPDDPLLGGDILVSDGTSVYLGSMASYEIEKVVPGGAGPQVLATILSNPPASIAVDATYVYWSVFSESTIQRTRKDNAWQSSTQNVVCMPGAVSNIATDGTDVYYETVEGNNTTMWRAPIPPG